MLIVDYNVFFFFEKVGGYSNQLNSMEQNKCLIIVAAHLFEGTDCLQVSVTKIQMF